MKGGQRRVSCVTFGENNIIEIEKREDTIDKQGKENDEKIGQIRGDNQKDGDMIFNIFGDCLTFLYFQMMMFQF